MPSHESQKVSYDLRGLQIPKSSGPDGVHPVILRALAMETASKLVDNFNLFLDKEQSSGKGKL